MSLISSKTFIKVSFHNKWKYASIYSVVSFVHIRASYEISTYQMNMNIYFMKDKLDKTATLVFLFIR